MSEWLSQSTDLNPVKNMWHRLEYIGCLFMLLIESSTSKANLAKNNVQKVLLLFKAGREYP